MSENTNETNRGVAAVASAYARVDDALLPPLVRLAPTPVPPTIDGVFSPGEWDHAFKGAGIVAMDFWGIDPIEVHYWFTYDAERVYLAGRMQTPPGECYARRPRRLGGETVSGHFEFLIDPNPCNPDTNWVQAMLYPLGEYRNVGYSQRIGGNVPYEVAWEYKDSWEDGWWTIEMSAPIQAFNNATIVEGASWGVLFAGGTSGTGFFSGTLGTPFALRSRYLKCIFDREAPVVQVEGLGDISSGRISPSILIYNTTGSDLALNAEYIIRNDIGPDALTLLHETQQHCIPGAATATLNWSTDLPSVNGKTSYLTIRLTSDGDSAPLYEGVYKLTCPRTPRWPVLPTVQSDPIIVNVNYYPYPNRVRVVVDFAGLPDPKSVTEIGVKVTAADGTCVGSATSHGFDNHTAEMAMSLLEELVVGRYTVTATLSNNSGEMFAEHTASFDKKHFPFEHHSIGISERVLTPWTPIVVDPAKDSVAVWNREYHLGSSGLPAEIISAGAQILAHPITLLETVAGTTLPLRGDGVKFSNIADHMVLANATACGRVVSARVEILGEFDGMLKYEVTLTGEQGACIDGLDLVIPLKAAHARYLHATGDGCRCNYSHAVPEGEGVVWDSTAIINWVMPASWLSYAWLGDYERGLCWWADSAEGWALPEDKKTPTVEIVRRAGVTELVFHLISHPTTVLWGDEKPRKLVFALEATPIKPRASWARDIGLCDAEITKQKFPRFAWLGYGTPGVWWTHVGRQAEKTPSTFAYLRPFDAEAEEKLRELTAKARREGRTMLVYTDMLNRALADDESKYYAAEWSPDSSDILSETIAHAPRWTTIGVAATQSRMDYDLWCLNLDMDLGIECWYFDEIQTSGQINPLSGLGYQDEDGRWIPTMRLSQYRQYWKRLYTMMQERGHAEPVIIIHNTSTTYAGPMAFCAATWDLEEANPDHKARQLTKYGMDYLITEVMGHQYGFVASTLGPAPLFEPWLEDYPEERDSVERHWSGIHMLLDMTPYLTVENYTDRKLADSATTDHPFLTSPANVQYGLRLLGEFGWNEADCQWLPFWKADEEGLFSGTPVAGVYASAYLRGNRAFLIILNDTNEEQVVDWRYSKHFTINTAVDAENGIPIALTGDGSVRITIPHYNYRALLLKSSAVLPMETKGI